MKKTRVSIVSYLNSKPFLYGLNHSPVLRDIELTTDIPSKVASKMAMHLADVGLIPVAGLEDLNHYRIISRYCIASVGKVKTVVIASEVPLEKVETILMDYQSRSSVLLSKVLARFYWKKVFNWEKTCSGFEKKSIEGTTAGVIIGDRVFEAESKYPFIYDLSEEWISFTGLPFVFAVWATGTDLPEQTEEGLDAAFTCGVENIADVVRMEQPNYPGVDIYRYFTENISFELDQPKREGMRKFLELAGKLEPVKLA